ncbi:glycosyltransferase [Microbacterium sp. zg-YB36]|uniref:glycosyltransferase n=1 Tax=Microbacterium sp. zg-YB36 TaxID=2969407 RepID=UPI00214AA6E6|nr:glycosyltransferase [Microbacterium sp. zg-YB36]MDL5352324.1 glycosyltransferase [Microbacterium sp. zg-YB36]
MANAAEVCIVQPYVPLYRVAFFSGLREVLSRDGIGMTVVAGKPNGSQAARGDQARAEWAVDGAPRQLQVAGRTLTVGNTRRFWKGADAVIMPLMGSSLDPYLALTSRNTSVGLWGHVESYVSPPNPLDAALERWMVRKADHIFAYTPTGARKAISWGAHPHDVTTVMNSVDTTALRRDLRAVRSAVDLDKTKIATFASLGGLDSSKRLGFLAEVLQILADRDVPVRILVGGEGEDRHLLDSAAGRGQVRILGYVGGHDKANLLAQSIAILSPGRIGLLAVDALAAGIPIITTTWPYHAPEAEYLAEGVSVFTSQDTPLAYADLVERIANRSGFGPADWDYPTLEQMVQNYHQGVLKLLA